MPIFSNIQRLCGLRAVYPPDRSLEDYLIAKQESRLLLVIIQAMLSLLQHVDMFLLYYNV